MRASDLDMKISYLRGRNGTRVVTFATATPIANSTRRDHGRNDPRLIRYRDKTS